MTLDAFVDEHDLQRIDLIKIDVEGFEPEVLAGARRTLERFHPSVLLEFNSFTLIAYGNHNPRTLLETLLDTFPHVYRFQAGKMIEIRDDASRLAFLHDNLVKHGCVDDLYCSYEG